MRKSALLRAVSVLVLSIAAAPVALAAGGGAALDHANNNVGDKKSLQRGAGYFMNYCSGCHGAKYVRYNTLGDALGLSEEQLEKNLMFNADRTFETINAAMSTEDAVAWLGAAPPDMSLIARSKGVDHIYTFLRSYYADDSSRTGWNNTLVKNVSMPHVLWNLEGIKVKASAHDGGSEGEGDHAESGDTFETIEAGTLSAEEYDQFVRDIVNFLSFISEPMQLERQRIGIWIMAFLVLFFIVSLLLKKEIWKDVK